MLAAGAQESGGAATPPGACTFSAAGEAPGTVTGSVTAPAGAKTVTVTFTPDAGQAGSPQSQTFPVPAGGGTINFSFDVAVPGVVRANFSFGDGDGYSTGCSGPGGIESVSVHDPVPSGGASGPTQTHTATLAFTGSDSTPSYVLIGVAAVVLGAVLILMARRRRQVP
jgi:LPXTG-motif cell wall-anchored protein